MSLLPSWSHRSGRAMAIGMYMKPCLHTGQVGPALAGWAGFSWLGWLCLLSLVALIFGGMKDH